MTPKSGDRFSDTIMLTTTTARQRISRGFGMKTILTSLALLGLVLAGTAAATTGAIAQEEAHSEAAPTHFPIHQPKEMDWSFAGPFGTYDKAQLQRGLKVFKEVCAACHSMKLVAFRTLEDLGYSEAQVKALAAEYTINDGPNDAGDMFDRPGIPSDYFPAPYPNDQAAAAANGGAAPPDMSLLAKARGVTRGFPRFVFDIFTQYAQGGPDYIHSLLTGYDEQPPAGMEIPEGTHYNPYFIAGVSLKMPNPLSNDQVTYDDGAPQTVDQYSRDVSAFLMWAAEPHLEDRKKTGFRVLVFLLLFGALVYLTKRKVWAGVAH
ncbi:ribosomal protein P2 [Mesorhizobium sp. L48C026A00]|nr:ribosomal protein P2 [Mesorhizobium sp. L48C026A00]